jgi:rhamnose transport system ATP-binding protein
VIGDLAAEGLAVIVVSSYLPDILGLADRILVMRDRHLAGELAAAGASEEDILHLASPGAIPASRMESTPATKSTAF